MTSTRSLIRIALIAFGLTVAAASVDAAPAKRYRQPTTELTDAEEATARAEIAKAKADGKRARNKLKLLKAQRSAAKAQQRADKAKTKAQRIATLQACLDSHTDLDDEDAQAACSGE